MKISTYTSNKKPITAMKGHTSTSSIYTIICHQIDGTNNTANLVLNYVKSPEIEIDSETISNVDIDATDISQASNYNVLLIDYASYVGLVLGNSYILSLDSPLAREFVYPYSVGVTDVTWTNLVGCTAIGNEIVKTTAGQAWNSGGFSNEFITGDGEVSFELPGPDYFGSAYPTLYIVSVGLSADDAGATSSSIDYTMQYWGYFQSGVGIVEIFRDGTSLQDDIDAYEGDVLSIQRINDTIYYKKNGFVIATSTSVSTEPLYVDCSILCSGNKLYNVKLATNTTVASSYLEAPISSTVTSESIYSSGTQSMFQLLVLSPGSASSNIAKIYQYRLPYTMSVDGNWSFPTDNPITIENILDLDTSGSPVTDAIGIVKDSINNIWVVTNETPSRLVRVWNEIPIWRYEVQSMEP